MKKTVSQKQQKPQEEAQLPSRKKGKGHIRIRCDKHGNPKYQMIIETWKDADELIARSELLDEVGNLIEKSG